MKTRAILTTVKTRAILTTVWISSLFVAIAIVEAYFFRHDANGIPLLIPPDRVPIYQALALIYGVNLGAILTAWFTKPFPKLSSSKRTRFLNEFALILTVAYNMLLLYLIAQGHLSQTNIMTSLHNAKVIGGVLAFLVTPVNTYYFGIKKQT